MRNTIFKLALTILATNALLLSSCAIFRDQDLTSKQKDQKKWRLEIQLEPGYGPLDLPIVARYPETKRYSGVFFGPTPDVLVIYPSGNLVQMTQFREELISTGKVIGIRLQESGR